MKHFLALIVTLLLSTQIQAGTEIQNGGGGISINGHVATFYSASMKVYPEPLTRNSDFDNLESLIGKLIIPNRVKLELIQNISPSFKRRYYSVDQNSVDSALLATIKEEYHRATNIPLEELTIFALTDPKTQVTLLLPDYFKLNTSERQAILLHESLWINSRVPNYSKMLEIDQAAQIYFTFPDDCVSTSYFLEQLESIFKERLWTFGTSLSCEVAYYQRVSRTNGVPYLDFFEYENLQAFAKLLLNSSRYYQPEREQQALANSLEKSTSRIFNTSKEHLIKELRKGLYIESNFSSSLRNDLNETRFKTEQERVDALVEVLLISIFQIKEINTATYYLRIVSPEVGEILITTPNNLALGKK